MKTRNVNLSHALVRALTQVSNHKNAMHEKCSKLVSATEVLSYHVLDSILFVENIKLY